MSLSTHVLDAVSGRPAEGVSVIVESRSGDTWKALGPARRTDPDGRIADLAHPGAGVHRISFDTGAYFTEHDLPTFYPQVSITFEVVDAAAHHHVPLLLSPYAFSTYRGS